MPALIYFNIFYSIYIYCVKFFVLLNLGSFGLPYRTQKLWEMLRFLSLRG